MREWIEYAGAEAAGLVAAERGTIGGGQLCVDGLPVAHAPAAGGAREFGDCVSGVEREEARGSHWANDSAGRLAGRGIFAAAEIFAGEHRADRGDRWV